MVAFGKKLARRSLPRAIHALHFWGAGDLNTSARGSDRLAIFSTAGEGTHGGLRQKARGGGGGGAVRRGPLLGLRIAEGTPLRPAAAPPARARRRERPEPGGGPGDERRGDAARAARRGGDADARPRGLPRAHGRR